MDFNTIKAGDIITANFDLKLVALSFLVAMAGSLAALDFAAHIRRPNGRLNWWALASSGIALGGGAIWTMHFIGMTAFTLPFRASFSALPTWLSLAVAVSASMMALTLVFSTPQQGKPPVLRILLGGTFAGAGVAGMHYIGMYAWQTQATLIWSIPLVVASVLIAVTAASAALWLSYSVKSGWAKTGASFVMATAVCGMHYMGMFSGTLVCTATSSAVEGSFFSGSWLPYLVSFISVTSLVVVGILALFFSDDDDAPANALRR
jgi:NO-binding membrane sensor protein with MHYT domain